jgi:two-component system, chemotaxis family, chemotaxis protein CheY
MSVLRKVLVVEDSKLVHMMYDLMLSRFEIVHAHDGVEAAARLQEHQNLDAVLLDMNMPRMDGMAFLRLIKADPIFAKIPVVVVTTDGTEETCRRAVETGAAAFLTKPFKAEAILEVLNRLIPNHS